MKWLQSNWIWIALGVGFIALHMFGHSGHGHGHSGRSRFGGRDRDSTNGAADAPSTIQDHNGAIPATAANSNDPAWRGTADHTGHDSSPTTADTKRHRHGC